MYDTVFCHTKKINELQLTTILGISQKQAEQNLALIKENNILYQVVAPKTLEKSSIFEYEAKRKNGGTIKVSETFSQLPLAKEIGFKLGSNYFWYEPAQQAFINKEFGKPLFTSNYVEQCINLVISYPYNYDVFMCEDRKKISEFYDYFENSDILVCQFM